MDPSLYDVPFLLFLHIKKKEHFKLVSEHTFLEHFCDKPFNQHRASDSFIVFSKLINNEEILIKAIP